MNKHHRSTERERAREIDLTGNGGSLCMRGKTDRQSACLANTTLQMSLPGRYGDKKCRLTHRSLLDLNGSFLSRSGLLVWQVAFIQRSGVSTVAALDVRTKHDICSIRGSARGDQVKKCALSGGVIKRLMKREGRPGSLTASL